MSEHPFLQHIKVIHAQISALHQNVMSLPKSQQKQITVILRTITASLDSLLLSHEEMQTSLEASAMIEEKLVQQSEQALAQRDRYYELFQLAPDASLLTDANGLILEANLSACQMLNVAQISLIRKPLVVFVPQEDRPAFRAYLNRLSHGEPADDWEIRLCPRGGKPFIAGLKVAITRNSSGDIAALRIGMRDISQYQPADAQPLQLLEQSQNVSATPVSLLPRSLDGLQVLIVDDEADAREFISAVLESHGIRVTAVASAAAALQALEQFRPDVIISDIRMPDENGYSLIRKIRQLEAEKGWRIPAAALTAYLTEDREKAIAAGFESHLHKLAQPTELVEMIVRLASRE